MMFDKGEFSKYINKITLVFGWKIIKSNSFMGSCKFSY